MPPQAAERTDKVAAYRFLAPPAWLAVRLLRQPARQGAPSTTSGHEEGGWLGEGWYKLLKQPLLWPLEPYPSFSPVGLVWGVGGCLRSLREHVPVGSLQWNKLSLEANERNEMDVSSSYLCWRETVVVLVGAIYMISASQLCFWKVLDWRKHSCVKQNTCWTRNSCGP